VSDHSFESSLSCLSRTIKWTEDPSLRSTMIKRTTSMLNILNVFSFVEDHMHRQTLLFTEACVSVL
jgi:hypothetical protein